MAGEAPGSLHGWGCTPTGDTPPTVAGEQATKPACLPVLLRGWRKTALYCILVFLMVLIFLNIGLTLWIISSLKLRMGGFGPMNIVKGGIELQGQAFVMDNLIASSISSRAGQPVTLHSYRNFSILVTEPERKETAKLVLKRDSIECSGRMFEVRDAHGGEVFRASRDEVRVFSDVLAVDGPGGLAVRTAVQAPSVRAPPGSDLHGNHLEKMLVARLRFHLLPRMSTRQFGFMPQRSTEDSLYRLMQHIYQKLNQKKIVTIISLDIEGAFDSAWWPAIRVRLAEEKCPLNLRRILDSYLNEREVELRYAGAEVTKGTNKGCVQGSIGGPILWNLLLDPLLQSLEGKGVFCQAFADDVVLVHDGKTALEVERSANLALEHVREWGVKNKLKFAPQKTNAMIITRKLKYDSPRLNMGGTNIGISKEIKLLGVTIDEKLTFNTHVANVCKKATGVYKQLSKAARVGWGLNPEVIRIIYVATIEPILLYAASVWAPAAEKLMVRKHLDVVQRGVAQKLCRAYRTVSLNSALVLAGILPLDLRVREAAALYEAKRGVPRPSLRDREVETMAPAIEAPHPADQTTLSFISLTDQEQVNNNSEQEIRIFTDGSKIGGKVGAAISIWNSEAEIKALKLALPEYCTVYQAELLAICRATRVILSRSESTFGIFSDSTAALQTVTNYRCLHPLAVETRDNIRSISHQNKIITLFWIKAHAGLEGNERADQLAKSAATGSKKRPEYDLCPISYVKRDIRMLTLDEWNRRYTTGCTASITKLFFPDAIAAYRTVRKLQIDSVTTQIFTGHGGFSEYLNRFKCKDNPSCICDSERMETVPHILLECPVYGLERLNLEYELNMEISLENISKIMEGRNRDKFLQYCKCIAKRVIENNKTR